MSNEKISAKSMTRAIVVLVIATLIMIAAGFANFKFPPILVNFMQYYGLEMGAMGTVMSVFQWACIVAMLPAGLMISRLSSRWAGVIGCGCIILGNIVGLVGTTVFMLILGRIIEALGFCLLQILTQSVIVAIFRGQKFLGTATGILNTGMMFGQIIHFSTAPRVVQTSAGLAGVYYYIMITIAVLAILWVIVISGETQTLITQSTASNAGPQLSKEERRAKKLSVFKTPQIWLIAVGFSLVGGAVGRVGQYIPTYMSEARGLDPVVAGDLNSLASAIGIAIFIIYGIAADWLKTRRKLMIFSCLTVIPTFLALLYLPASMMIVFIFLYGTFPRAFTTLTYSCYPDLFDDGSLVPVAHSVVQFMGNIIGALLTMAFGYIIQYSGYDMLWYFCMVLGVLAAVCWYFAKKIK